MRVTRKEFIVAAGTFAVMPSFASDGRQLKVPLMLDTKRMAIWDGPGIRTTFFVKGCPLTCHVSTHRSMRLRRRLRRCSP